APAPAPTLGTQVVAPSPPGAPMLSPVGDGQAAAGSALVRLRLDYSPMFDEDEDPWDLYVYLSGAFAGWARGDGVKRLGNDARSDLVVAPGRYRLGMAQERHARRGKGFRHEVRVGPNDVLLDIGAGERWTIELTFPYFVIGIAGAPAPVQWRILRDDEAIETGESDTLPADWPSLCEALEANVKPGKRPPLPVRRALEHCTRWAAWTGGDAGPAPSRTDVRTFLEGHDFRPVPRDVGR
ncbi:MAG: hypothetical protein AAF772_18015, partial [Acidobacteriota bacterium]